jgi:hypothetical protein
MLWEYPNLCDHGQYGPNAVMIWRIHADLSFSPWGSARGEVCQGTAANLVLTPPARVCAGGAANNRCSYRDP